MSARRLLKAGEAIREVVSMAILTELRDPRVKNVTVIGMSLTMPTGICFSKVVMLSAVHPQITV